MRSRITLMSAAVAVVALTIGLICWLNSGPKPIDPPAITRDATPPKGDTADPSHESEERAAAEVAALVPMLKHEDARVRVSTAEELVRLSPTHRVTAALVLVTEFQSLDPHVRAAALDALVQLKGKVTPALVAAARTVIQPTRDVIGEVLHRIGSEGLPPLVAAFAGPDPELRQFANHELRRWGVAATPDLTAALQSPQFLAERPRLALLLLELDPAHVEAATPHLLALLKEADGDLRRRGLEMIVKIGPKAEQTPVLVAVLGDADPTMRALAAIALRQIGPGAVPALRAVLTTRAAGRESRGAALEVLTRLGPVAQSAAPELIDLLKGDEEFLHPWAARALLRMGPAGVAGLMAVLRDRTTPGWSAAAAQVCRLGPAAQEAAPALGAVLRDPGLNLAEKELIAGALENIGPPAVPTLAALAQTPGGAERNLAIQALGRLGAAARDAIPALATALRHLPDGVSEDAAVALAALGPVAVPALRDGLRDKNAGVRGNAAAALGRIGAPAQEAVPELCAMLKERTDGLCYAAAAALLQIGPTAKEALPGLQSALQADDPTLRVLAAGALLRIDPKQPAAATILQDALASREDPAKGPLPRLLAADAVQRLGPTAKQFAPALEPLLKDDRVRVSAAAALLQGDPSRAKELLPVLLAGRLDQNTAEALERLGPTAKEALPTLRVTLDNVDNTAQVPLRQALVKTLRAIGPDAAPALLAVVKRTDMLYRKDPVILDALRALADLAPKDKANVQELADLLRNVREQNAKVRVLAVEMLADIGPDAAPAVPALMFVLADDDVLLRTRAVEALGQIGPAAQVATGELQMMSERDPFPHVRAAAAAALRKIADAK